MRKFCILLIFLTIFFTGCSNRSDDLKEPTAVPNNIKAEDIQKTSADGPIGEASKKSENNPVAVNEKYAATETSYKSDSKNIEIKRVVIGEGTDMVTYYVADVKLTNIAQMKSAFAKNKFGLNIIEYTSVIAKANNAILAINGDYYGFRKDGIEIRNGELFRDTGSRQGLAFYKDGSMKIYDEKQTKGEELLKNGVWNTVSFGPALLNEGKICSNIGTYELGGRHVSHTIQGYHPRTGIGMIDKNHFVFVVVDGRCKDYSKGATLEEFANIFQGLGCSTAYNLDGGYCATMYFMGKLVNKPGGKEKERGISDIIYIK